MLVVVAPSALMLHVHRFEAAWSLGPLCIQLGVQRAPIGGNHGYLEADNRQRSVLQQTKKVILAALWVL